MRLQYKIVVPFVALFVAAVAVIALTAVAAVSRTLDSRLETQVIQASAFVSQAEFARNRLVLERLKEMLGAEIITFGPDGQVLATTSAVDPSVLAERALAAADPAAVRDGLVIRDLEHGGVPYTVAYRPLRTPPGAVMAVLTPTADIATARRDITRTVLLTALVILILMVGASQMLARSVTAPIARLAVHADEVAAGGVGSPPEVGDDEVGRLARSFGAMVTQLRASEARLLRSEKEAVTGLLAARVAHDVRNPLSSLKMQAQMLRRQLEKAGDRTDLALGILKEVDRVEWVVKGLLELSRPGEPQPRPAQLNDVVDDVLDDLAPQLRYQKVLVEQSLSPELPVTGLDVDRVKLALLNLMVNAAEAMPAGGTMRVATRLGDGGSAIVVEIRDDGVGIDPAVRDRLFDPFVSTKREGVGLGLVNAKHVVEGHGGTLELRPRSRRGTLARLTFPVTDGAAMAATAAAEDGHG